MPPIKKKIELKINSNTYKKKITIKNYKINLEKQKFKTLEITNLINKSKKNTGDLPQIITELKNVAKNSGYKKIIGETWIFSEHPKIAEKLNVVVDVNKIISFNEIKKKNNIVKIIGINKNFMKKTNSPFIDDPAIKFYNKNTKRDYNRFTGYLESITLFDCIVKTEKGLEQKSIFLPSKDMLVSFKINL